MLRESGAGAEIPATEPRPLLREEEVTAQAMTGNTRKACFTVLEGGKVEESAPSYVGLTEQSTKWRKGARRKRAVRERLSVQRTGNRDTQPTMHQESA